MPFAGLFVELCDDSADQIEESSTVALLVVGISVLRQAAAELGIELCGRDDLGCCKERAGGKVLTIVSGRVCGFDDIRYRELVDFVAGFHDLLFEIEENFGEARTLLGEGEDRLVDDL